MLRWAERKNVLASVDDETVISQSTIRFCDLTADADVICYSQDTDKLALAHIQAICEDLVWHVCRPGIGLKCLIYFLSNILLVDRVSKPLRTISQL